MRTNRKRPLKMSVTTSRSLNIGGVLLLLSCMVIVNFLANSFCSQKMKAIGEKQRTLARLEQDCQRERARWESMKTAANLDRALLRHGLAMRVPRPDQYVYVQADGRPYPGQHSVDVAMRRNRSAGMTASVTPASSGRVSRRRR